jgi:hypothetical protein
MLMLNPTKVMNISLSLQVIIPRRPEIMGESRMKAKEETYI